MLVVCGEGIVCQISGVANRVADFAQALAELILLNLNSIGIRITAADCVFKNQCRGAAPPFIDCIPLRRADL